MRLALFVLVFISFINGGCESLNRVQRSLNGDGLTREERYAKADRERLSSTNYAEKTYQCQYLGNDRYSEGIVRTYVSSYLDENNLIDPKSEFNFRYVKTKSLAFLSDNQRITKACQKVIARMGFTTHLEKKDCPKCVNVFLPHEFETKTVNGTSTSCFPVGNSTYCYSGVDSYIVGQRTLSVLFYVPGEEMPRYSALAYSGGSSRVTTVKISKEMCIAAFAGFPERRDAVEYNVPYCPDGE